MKESRLRSFPYRGALEIGGEHITDLEAFPFDEEVENERLSKPAGAKLEGITALQKR